MCNITLDLDLAIIKKTFYELSANFCSEVKDKQNYFCVCIASISLHHSCDSIPARSTE